jgi:hypothetical protein
VSFDTVCRRRSKWGEGIQGISLVICWSVNQDLLWISQLKESRVAFCLCKADQAGNFTKSFFSTSTGLSVCYSTAGKKRVREQEGTHIASVDVNVGIYKCLLKTRRNKQKRE